MIKLLIFTFSLNFAIPFCQSQSIIGINNKGKKISFFLPNDEKKDSLLFLNINPNKRLYNDLIIDNVNNWDNISVRFGIFIPKTMDTLYSEKEEYLINDNKNIYFVDSNYLDKSINYNLSYLFLNDSSIISFRYTPNHYVAGVNQQTKQIVWEKKMKCGRDVFSHGHLCGYQKPMLVMKGKNFICLKNKKYAFLPFKCSKMILINWENGEEKILKNNVFNINISPNADYLIYEKGNRKKNKKFQVYSITQKKVIKEIIANTLFWNN